MIARLWRGYATREHADSYAAMLKIEAIKAVAGDRYERAVVPEERRKHLVRWDDVAAHYEVDHSHGVSFDS